MILKTLKNIYGKINNKEWEKNYYMLKTIKLLVNKIINIIKY